MRTGEANEPEQEMVRIEDPSRTKTYRHHLKTILDQSAEPETGHKGHH